MSAYLALVLSDRHTRRWCEAQGIRLVDAIADSPTKLKAAVASLVVLTSAAIVGGPWLWGLIIGPGSCRHPAELRILTSPDGLGPTKELTRRYELSSARANHDCPSVSAYVYAGPVSAVTTALARGWVSDDDQSPLVTLGPRPDVWLPDSTVDVRRLRDLAAAAHLMTADEVRAGKAPAWLADITAFASSPMVLGVPDSSPGRVGGTSWPEIVSNFLQGPGPPLVAPDPEVSTAGLIAASGYLSESDGRPEALGLAGQRVRSISAGSPVGEDSTTLLCRLRRQYARNQAEARNAEPEAAVLTSRQMWRRFVAGKPLGGACQDPAAPVREGTLVETQLGTPVLDHPLVEFAWTADKLRPWVDDFRRWLSTQNGQAGLDAVGLDPARPDCVGLDHNPCVPEGLEGTLTLYREAKAPGRVLLALDTSGSMRTRTAAGPSRLEIASRAVIEGLGYMGQNDQFGLWSFPAAGEAGRAELVPIRNGTAQHKAVVVGALKRQRPAGATPLFGTVLAGMRAVAGPGADSGSSQVRALIVLTDGEDTSRLDPDEVETQVRRIAATRQVQLYVIATGDATCQSGRESARGDGRGDGRGELRRLTDAGRGTCIEVDQERLAGETADLFAVLWGGR